MEAMLSNICNSVTHFFKVTTSKVGKKVGFIKRNSKLTASLFIQPIRWQDKRELSLKKAYKLLRHSAENFFIALQTPYRLIKFMKIFWSVLKVFGMKDRGGKKRRTSYGKLMDFSGQEVLI